MPDLIPNIPPTKLPGQRSLGYEDAYLARFVPAWNMPPSFDAYAWRALVAAQPVAVICRDTLISSILSLDWKVTVRDSKMQDDLAGTVKYYSRLLENAGYGCDLDYTSHVEWIAGDVLDTSFGGASELGRKGDNPSGRVAWIEPIDSGTLSPTLNYDYPVMQYYAGQSIPLPKYAVARAYMTPRSDIRYRGWGIAPPERAFLALQMMSRGDTYYANLLLDIPTTGILDLGDMEKDSALEWVEAYKALLNNGSAGSFRIPVLYEHENDIKFVPFGKVPNDIMFDRITLRYAALIAAAYGMTLSDIGIQTTSSGGETLAGSIRSERKTRKTGFARLKKKLVYYFNQILPPDLQFTWVDYDDEVNVALGRARMANATAFKTLKDGGFITADEGRQQLMADGMFTINMPEEAPDVATVSTPSNADTGGAARKVGAPVPPSMGGHGDVTAMELRSVVADVLTRHYEDIRYVVDSLGEDNPIAVRSAVSDAVDEYVPTGELPDVEKFVIRELAEIILVDTGLDLSDPEQYNSVLDSVVSKFTLGEEDVR